jgi:hypothetical protein
MKYSFYHFRYRRGGQLVRMLRHGTLQRGGFSITLMESEGRPVVGISKCCMKDTYCKASGRNISMYRARLALDKYNDSDLIVCAPVAAIPSTIVNFLNDLASKYNREVVFHYDTVRPWESGASP